MDDSIDEINDIHEYERVRSDFPSVPMVDMSNLTQSQQDLLQYYKDRIESFERERGEYLSRVRATDEDGETGSTMKYKHMWEMQRKDEQIADLQRALSDAHVYLYDERQQVLALSAENDELKIQELEDRKRIQHLLALTQPVSQEVTYFKDRRPHTMTRNYPSTKNQLFGTASSRTDPDSNMGASARRGKASQGIGLAREVEARYRAEGQGQEKKWGGNGYGAANDDDRHDGNTTDAGRRKEERTGSPLRVVLGDLPSDKAQTTPHNGAEEELAVYKKKGGRNVRFAWNSTLNRKEEPAKKTGGTSKHKSGRGKGQNVVRTIYMPNESVDVLKLIIRSLRTQLDEQAALAQQRCQALLEDRLIREAEAKEREETQRAQIKDVSKKLSEAQQNIRTVTKDFLELKHTAQSRERNLKERASEANLQNQALKKKMQTLSKRAKKSENKIKEETDNYVDHFRTQTITKEEDLAVIKAQYNATQELYEKRIKYLEGRLTTLKGKYSVLERRRNLEVEGFINDFKFARGKIRNMQKLMMRLKLGLQAVLDNTIQDMLEQENETHAHAHAHAHAHTRAGMGSTSANTTINTTNNHSYSSHNSSLQTEGVSRARRSRHNTSTATGHNTSTRTGKRVSKQHNTSTGSSSGSKQRRAQQERNRQLLQDLASKFQIAEEDVKAIKQHLTRVADRLDTATA